MTTRNILFAPLVLFAVLLGYGCDTDDARIDQRIGVGPSKVDAPFVNVLDSVSFPASIEPLVVSGALCPGIPPFLAPLSVAFHGDGQSGLSLSQVRMEFVDRTGLLGPSMTIPTPQLIDRFGSVGLPAFGTREFGFSFPFGCAGVPTGTLVVVLVVDDGFGRERRVTRRIAIR